MGETVYCESFLPSMRDLSEDSNSCSRSTYCNGDKTSQYRRYQTGFSMRAAAGSYAGHERDFLKQKMLQHEAVFKNQVFELHRLYRTQKSLMDEVVRKHSVEQLSRSGHTLESEVRHRLPEFLLGNSICGEGSSSRARNVPMQNGISSKDKEVLKVRPVKARRTTIDLQLPADEYLDADGEITSCLPYDMSESGKEIGRASHQNGSSGSSLLMKTPNGLTGLNEPVQCQRSAPFPSSGDLYSTYGRNVAHVQGHWLERNINRSGWMVIDAGHGKSSTGDKLCLPSHSLQALPNNAGQPLGYHSTDHRKLSGERPSLKWEARQRKPEVSYDSNVESSVASNAPRLNHGYPPESVRPWSHWITSSEKRSSSSVQKPLPLQTNPFFSYQGVSSGPKDVVFNFPPGNFNDLSNGPKGAVTNGSLSEASKYRSLENLEGPNKQGFSTGLPWIKPKPLNKNGITNGGLDLNASANHVVDGSDGGYGSNNVSPHNGIPSVSCSNDNNLQQAEMADSQISELTISHKHSVCKGHPSLILSSVSTTPKEVNTLVKRNLDINLPCEAAEGKRAHRGYIDLNLCASEDEDSGLGSNPVVLTKASMLIDLEAPPTLESEEEGEKFPKKRDEESWLPEKVNTGDSVDDLVKAAAEVIVTISHSHPCRNIDEAAFSSTDAVAKDPLTWFANTIASCGNDLGKKIDAYVEARDCESCREECSSGEYDYFEAMTLNLPHTKEEDYMPKPLVPEYLQFDGMDSMGVTANRPRRGQARRGRPRRDFQRDILPGLASLSRQEVTEDLQSLGGLMKASCYKWNSGMGRRSSNRGGSSRGRKRLVSNNTSKTPSVCSSLAQPMNNNSVQMVGLEGRSFTGWGNATRRPRRQRCPAGNPPNCDLNIKCFKI